MKKYQRVQQQFLDLQNCQKNLFQAIERRQKQLEKQLKDRVDKYNCQLARSKQIKGRNNTEQIKNPHNDGIYRYLGNCLQDFQMTDLEDIKARQGQRRKQMERVNECRSLEADGREVWFGQEQRQEEYRQGKQKDRQIPWKLVRKLREQDVQQNRKRIEKQLNNKLQKISQKYK